MTTQVILTVAGSDRPGLTQALADAVLAAGGNWLESHLATLGGKYVGSVLVELAEDAVPHLQASARAIDMRGLTVSVLPTGPEEFAGPTLALDLVGQDRPGIVREVTAVLADLGVNIDDLHTRVDSGAESGQRMFRATATLRLPAEMESDTVIAALEEISGEIMVELTFG
ncbi:glycine cleavage system protein R [Sphingomonas radiodurans]|uniref:glycine cleavage system protein R n=1 Tax=Sphingomonas radiodurans TaxID=2890321 RepID=UPI001E3AE823|nr:ACT domain-containing protein [Sphingomonas radiodurans]WBH16239.1 ACT domain-containing protein [Sphingomonas radiodurans]